MSLHRFFLVAGAADGPLPLSERDVRHLRTVLRVSAGDEFIAVEPGGRALHVRVDGVDEHGVHASILGEETPRPEPRVTLVQGVCRGPRMDLVIQKAVEVGVVEIVPFLGERSVVKLDAKGRREKTARWQRIAEEAAKQSQRSFVPAVREPVPSRELPAVLAGYDAVVLLWEDAEAGGIGEALEKLGATSSSTVAVVVGPEGGLGPFEVDSVKSVGAQVATLGDTILRTETAGIVGSALAIYELGGLGGRRDR